MAQVLPLTDNVVAKAIDTPDATVTYIGPRQASVADWAFQLATGQRSLWQFWKQG